MRKGLILKLLQHFHIDKVKNFLIIQQGATPSEYMRQMSMTTEERTRHLFKLRNKFNYFFFCPEDCNFEITPSVVIFQQFTVGNVFSVTVTVRNKTKVILNYI